MTVAEHRVAARMARAAWQVVAAIKNALVSDASRDLKARWGPARGAVVHTSYRYGLRKLFGLYESEVLPYVRRYVRPGDVCWDIGAAEGYYGFAFARLAAPGRVYCFDIDPQLVGHLTRLATTNAHLGSVVTVHPIRLGSSPIDDTQTSVDALVYERGWRPPNVLKMDVDGDEVRILQGALRVLRQHHPRLIIEVHSEQLEADCRDLLRSIGYDVIVVPNRIVMAEHAFRPAHNRWICGQ